MRATREGRPPRVSSSLLSGRQVVVDSRSCFRPSPLPSPPPQSLRDTLLDVSPGVSFGRHIEVQRLILRSYYLSHLGHFYDYARSLSPGIWRPSLRLTPRQGPQLSIQKVSVVRAGVSTDAVSVLLYVRVRLDMGT